MSIHRAVVRVGGGRGFVAESRDFGGLPTRFVVTAAHCLPSLPVAASFLASHEWTHPALLGTLDAEPAVTATVRFVNPVADLAILERPDDQERSVEAEAFDRLVESAEPLPIADAPRECSARVLSLAGLWNRCTVRHFGGPLWIFDARNGIEPGMSGSPIIDEKGSAIGVVVSGWGEAGPSKRNENSGPSPHLTNDLPGWFLREPVS